MSKKNKINIKHKEFVDVLFTNGFHQENAYKQVYDVGDKYCRSSATRLMYNPTVKAYFESKYAEYRKRLDIDKQKMLDMLMDEINLFNEMKGLAQKKTLTEEETSKFNRLTTLLKASDINKARDMINRLIGAYEAEKQEITHKGITINIIKPDDDKL